MTSSFPFTLRKALPSEAPLIAEFQVAMALESEGLALAPETCRRGVEAVFSDPQKGHYRVVVDPKAEQPVIACTLLIPEWSDWRAGTVWWIHSVYVRPEYRRQGVFRALYQSLKIEVEADPSLRGLRLYVERDNRRAQATYEALGMSADHYLLYEWLKKA
jgi:GNAT superfamily N-acetyltransferase